MKIAPGETTLLQSRILNEDEFQLIRAAFWNYVMSGPGSLRYKMFDLGTLLLRNDVEGVKRKMWRDEVSDWLYVAMNRELQEPYNPYLTFVGAQVMIESALAEIESWLLNLGKSVLEEDQQTYYQVRLNNHLFRTHQLIAEGLQADSEIAAGLSVNHQYELANVHLTGLEWKACCATDGGYRCYEFKVGEPPYPKLGSHAVVTHQP